MADLKFTANTSEASKKINSLQQQIDKLEVDIAKNREINVNTKVAEAQIKGLRNAISSIMKDIAKETQQQALGTKDLLHADENIKKLKNLSNQITTLYKDIMRKLPRVTKNILNSFTSNLVRVTLKHNVVVIFPFRISKKYEICTYILY